MMNGGYKGLKLKPSYDFTNVKYGPIKRRTPGYSGKKAAVHGSDATFGVRSVKNDVKSIITPSFNIGNTPLISVRVGPGLWATSY